MTLPPNHLKRYCVRIGWLPLRRRPASGRPVCALVLMMVVVALALSAVSPLDDAIQPDFGPQLAAGKLAPATHAYTGVAIFPALVTTFHASLHVITAEAMVIAGPLATLAGAAAIVGARSPPQR